MKGFTGMHGVSRGLSPHTEIARGMNGTQYICTIE